MDNAHVLVGLTLLVATVPADAHGGELEADGCDRDRKTGDQCRSATTRECTTAVSRASNAQAKAS